MRTRKLILNCIIVVLALIVLLAITIAILFFYNKTNSKNLQNIVEGENNYSNITEDVIENISSNIIKNEVVENNTVDNNEGIIQDSSIEKTPTYYLKDYTSKAVYQPEEAYNLLDEEYKQKRFPSIESYKEYITRNIAKLENATVMKYELDNMGTYLQYTIIDSYNNNYIIKIYSSKEYRVIADNYTLNSVEYNQGNEKEKVAINIKKIVEAFNLKDYAYVYSKLSEEFKTQKYLSLQQFEDEMSHTLYGTFSVKFGDFKEEEGIYIYDIELIGNTASSSSLSMQFIMELKEEGSYSISFNIK